MDQSRLTDALNLPGDTPIVFVGLALVAWGQALHFTCEAAPPITPFGLQVAGCREMRWQHYTHLPVDPAAAFPRTRLVSFKLGRDQHRSPLHLLTDHFGLSVWYGQLCVLLDGDTRVIT